MRRKAFGKETQIFEVILIVVILIIFIVPLVLGFVSIFPPEVKPYYISIVSAMLGGLCTLVGVILTIRFTEKERSWKEIKDYTPEFNVPCLFEKTQTTHITFKNNSDVQVPNIKLHFRNTDKVHFKIVSIEIGEVTLESQNLAYVNKNEYFCLCFYNKDLTGSLKLNVESQDSRLYCYNIRYEGDKVLDLWR